MERGQLCAFGLLPRRSPGRKKKDDARTGTPERAAASLARSTLNRGAEAPAAPPAAERERPGRARATVLARSRAAFFSSFASACAMRCARLCQGQPLCSAPQKR